MRHVIACLSLLALLAGCTESNTAQVTTTLATAQADLEDVDYNLSIVAMHQQASREGKIDANWWDAAMRFGMLDPGEEPVYRLGSYPVKVMRWIRHLIFTLNAERRDVLSAIADLEPKVAALSQIIGNAIQ